MMARAFGVADRHEWDEILSRFPHNNYAIFHTPSYVLSWKRYEQAEPVCLYAKVQGVEFLYPFFLLPCPAPEEGRYDVVSAYGYGGMISNRSDCPADILAETNSAIDEWCSERGVVAEFVREYPLGGYPRTTRRIHIRDNVYFRYGSKKFDFTNRIKKRARRDAKLSMKKGCTPEVDSELRTLPTFEKMYHGLAAAKDFPQSHWFSSDYLQDVTGFLSGRAFLINIRHGKKIIAAGLFLHHQDMMVYHLSASKANTLHLLPNDLLLYSALEEGARRNCAVLFLGGGLGTDLNDNLLRFKEKFATDRIKVHIGTKVHDQKPYDRLCQAWEEEHPEKARQNPNYFLKYRL